MTSLDDLVEEVQEELGGFGPVIGDAIRDEFADADEFIQACRRAYADRDGERLEEIDGVGSGYAIDKLAFWASCRFGWSDGGAEPVEIEVITGDELVEQIGTDTEDND